MVQNYLLALRSLQIIAVIFIVIRAGAFTFSAEFSGEIPAVEPFCDTDCNIFPDRAVNVIQEGKIAVQCVVKPEGEVQSAGEILPARVSGGEEGGRVDIGESGSHGVRAALVVFICVRIIESGAPSGGETPVDPGIPAVDIFPGETGAVIGIASAAADGGIMVIGLAEVEEETGINGKIFGRVETENRAEVTNVIEAVRLVDKAIPVIFHGEPFMDAVAASGLQTVDQTETNEVVFIDPVNFIKVVQMIWRFGGFGDVSIVDIGDDHMAETIEPPVVALDVLPGAVEFCIEFKADFPGEADA